MNIAKIVGLLALFVCYDLQSSPRSFYVSGTTFKNITLDGPGKMHGPLTLEQHNNATATGPMRLLDSKCNNLRPPLSPNATINSTATLSIKAIEPAQLLPGPVGSEKLAPNKCSGPGNNKTAPKTTGKCTAKPSCRNPNPPQELLPKKADKENDAKICSANAAAPTELPEEQKLPAAQESVKNATSEAKPCPANASTPTKESPPVAARRPADDECTISEVEDTTVIALCSACSARANEKGVGVTLTCFECHHVPADRTCHYSKYDPRFKVSTKFFEFSEYGGRFNTSGNVTTYFEDKNNMQKRKQEL